MHIELKKLHVSDRLSQETTAFAADIWIDGKKVGTAENDGHGGMTLIHVQPRDLLERAEAYCATLIPAEYKSFTGGLEWVVDDLVEQNLVAKDEAKWARRIAKIDAKEVAKDKAKGLRTARFQAGEEWRWFGYKPGSDPAKGAQQIAHKAGVLVDHLEVLS